VLHSTRWNPSPGPVTGGIPDWPEPGPGPARTTAVRRPHSLFLQAQAAGLGRRLRRARESVTRPSSSRATCSGYDLAPRLPGVGGTALASPSEEWRSPVDSFRLMWHAPNPFRSTCGRGVEHSAKGRVKHYNVTFERRRLEKPVSSMAYGCNRNRSKRFQMLRGVHIRHMVARGARN
jgi:hypothetical protein